MSENYQFAKKCEEAGIIFIGPSHKVIKALGDKINSKEILKNTIVPLIPSYNENSLDEIEFPVLLKPSAGTQNILIFKAVVEKE